jgi:hypothetical protein
MKLLGPFELRSETLAGALQLILADYEIAYGLRNQRGSDPHDHCREPARSAE